MPLLPGLHPVHCTFVVGLEILHVEVMCSPVIIDGNWNGERVLQGLSKDFQKSSVIKFVIR